MAGCGSRGISGVGLCDGQNTCCIQIKEDCGKDCDTLPSGFGIIRLENGELQLCINDGITCGCTAIASNQPQVVGAEGSSVGSDTITVAVGTTNDHLPFQISITNPSPTRDMTIQYNWSGYQVFLEHARGSGDVDVTLNPELFIDLGAGGGFITPPNFVILNNNLGYVDTGGTNTGTAQRTYTTQGFSGVTTIAPSNTFTLKSSVEVVQTTTAGLGQLIIEQIHASILGVVA